MNFLEKYPDLLTINQVAEILGLKPNTVYRLRGLVKTRVGNGRGLIRYKKEELINYISSRREEDVNVVANQKTQRYREVELPDLLTWQEIQTIRVEHKRGSPEGS